MLSSKGGSGGDVGKNKAYIAIGLIKKKKNMGDITENTSLKETKCRCGCNYHLKPEIKENILILAYAIQKIITVLSLIYQEDKIIVLFKWGENGGSWIRCPKHNKSVGGAKNSIHQKGLAADPQFYRKKQSHKIRIHPIIVARVAFLLKISGLINFNGIGCYRTFTHLDCRTIKPATWIKLDNGEYQYGSDFKNVVFG